jgi:hypothetical protein
MYIRKPNLNNNTLPRAVAGVYKLFTEQALRKIFCRKSGGKRPVTTTRTTGRFLTVFSGEL